MSSLSSSGARIRGDDFQHAYAAIRAVEVLLPDSTVTDIGVEDPDPAVHNADDVTIYRKNEPNEFVQAKSSVDASSPATIEWLVEASAGGNSILSHLYGAWTGLIEKGEDPSLILVSNKQIDPGDPVLPLREGTDGTVAMRLRAATAGSAPGRARASLASHLGVSEDELLRFLEHLSLRFGQLQEDHRTQLSRLLAAVGLRADRQAVDLCIGMVRHWVTSGKRSLTADEVRDEITALGIEASVPAATVVVQAIDHRPSEGAVVSLDWVDRFDGGEARSRRIPIDPEDWHLVFRPALLDAAASVRAEGLSKVHIGGAMRLPTWFAVGNAFAETSGFEVEAFQGGELWTSFGPFDEYDFDTGVESTDSDGDEGAVVISIATDIRDDAREHIATLTDVGSVLHVRPVGGPGSTAILNGRVARDMALAVRNKVRVFVRRHRPSKLHLFLASPGAFAMLLGHRWDRVADTQLYADLAPGYAEAYLIPN